jgi:undecaprenyl-diphosphatase
MKDAPRPLGYLLAALLFAVLFALIGAYAWWTGTAGWEVDAVRDFQAADVPGLRDLSIGLAVVGHGVPWAVMIGGVALALLLMGSLRLVLLLGVVAALQDVGSILKVLVERARPASAAVDVWRTADGYSFPSGHTLGATLIFGFLFFAVEQLTLPRAVRWGVQALCLALTLLMGLSRVEVGAHWPTDVLGAYLLGGLLLLPVVYVLRAAGPRSRLPV